MSPLANLVQSIHIHENGRPDRYILTTSVRRNELDFTLCGNSEGDESVTFWQVVNPKQLIDKEIDAAQAMKEGYLHLEWPSVGDDEVQLQFLPRGKKTITVQLRRQDEPSHTTLFNAAMALLSRSHETPDTSEVRALQAELSQKEAEIQHLNLRLQSAQATATRMSSQDKKKMPISPQKKLPPNASALQPNQKRRKAVEDEFAGSSDEEED